MRRSDGQYRWFLVRAVPTHDGQGGIIAWYGNSTDIDDRKRAEQKLRLSEIELEQIVNTIAQLVLFLDPDGRALHANQFMLAYTGLSPEEVTIFECACSIRMTSSGSGKSGLPAAVRDKGAWVMFAGTPYAYLHVCGSPWEGNEYHAGDKAVWTMEYSRS